jgi:hypothetical protein
MSHTRKQIERCKFRTIRGQKNVRERAFQSPVINLSMDTDIQNQLCF